MRATALMYSHKIGLWKHAILNQRCRRIRNSINVKTNQPSWHDDSDNQMKITATTTKIIFSSLLFIMISITILLLFSSLSLSSSKSMTSSSSSVLNQTAFSKLVKFPDKVLNPMILKREIARRTYEDLHRKTISALKEYSYLSNETKAAFQNATISTEDVKLAWCINILFEQHNSPLNTSNSQPTSLSNDNEISLRRCDIGVHDSYVAHNFSSDMKSKALLFLRARGT